MSDEDDVLCSFALAFADEPTPDTIRDWLKRHPEHAVAINAFAIELILEPRNADSDDE